MTGEFQPGSKDELYDEIRRRILRKQNRDRIDAYQHGVSVVRRSFGRTSDVAGSALGTRLARFLAVALTLFFAGAAVFLALNPDWGQTTPLPDARQEDAPLAPARFAGD